MTFDQVAWLDTFDGIWACASLLHVPRADLPAVMRRLRDALRPRGIWWMSFKYGTRDRAADGRHFTDMDEAAGGALLEAVGGLVLIAATVSADVRADRGDERWLSLLCCREL